MRKYNYDCNREEVTIWLPYHIVNLKGFNAFIINISPAPRNDNESDYSRVKISISTLEGRREPIICILKELFPIMENEKERIICNFECMATWASNCNYLMYNSESLMSDTPIIQNMSGAYYNRRMNTTVIYNYDALNNHINGSSIEHGGSRPFSNIMAPLNLFNETPKRKSVALQTLKNAYLWLSWPPFNEGVPGHFFNHWNH